MVVTKNCCLCIDLRAAGYAVASVDLVTSVTIVGGALWFIFIVGTMFHEDHPQLETNVRNWRIVTGCVISYFTIGAVICALLIWGIYKKKKYFLLPWLITKAVSLMLYTLFILIVGGLFLNTIEYQTGVVFYGCGIPFMGFCLYIWVCMFSLYQTMDYVNVPTNGGLELNELGYDTT